MTSIHISTATIASDFPVDANAWAVQPMIEGDELRRIDRRFRSRRAAVVSAAIERWQEEAMPAETSALDRRGVVLGTETGAGADIERFLAESITRGDALVNPGLFPWTVHNSAAGSAAIVASCRGPNIVTSAGKRTVSAVLLTAAALLRSGSADFVYCGVYESLGDSFGTIAAVCALATNPEMLGGRYFCPFLGCEGEGDRGGECTDPQEALRWVRNFSTRGPREDPVAL